MWDGSITNHFLMKTRTKETCKSFKRDFIGDYQSAKINCKIYDKIAILKLVSKVACGWNWSKFQSYNVDSNSGSNSRRHQVETRNGLASYPPPPPPPPTTVPCHCPIPISCAFWDPSDVPHTTSSHPIIGCLSRHLVTCWITAL